MIIIKIIIIIIRTLLDNTITGSSSDFHCGPDTNLKKILKITKTKQINKTNKQTNKRKIIKTSEKR